LAGLLDNGHNRVVVARLYLCTVVALAGCTRLPTNVEASESEPRPPGPTFVGDAEQAAAALAALGGVWAFESEVWHIEGARATVYRRRHQDIVVERQIEMIAPCMFVAREGEALLGPYVVQHQRGTIRTSWTRHGVAKFDPPGQAELVVCCAPEVFFVGTEHCNVWRFDGESESFEVIATCEDNVRYQDAETPPERTLDIWGPTENAHVPVPGWEILAGPSGSAKSAPDLASACERFSADELGCTEAQAKLLLRVHESRKAAH
jgi:hypothetical protein